jgi:hypothetical protein
MKNEAQTHVDGMDGDDLDKLILNLGKYCSKRCREFRWRTGNSFDLPNGETDDSIVSLALERVLDPLEKGRNWNPQTHPNFKGYLMDVIDSILNEYAESLDNTMLFNTTSESPLDNLTPTVVTKPKRGKENNNKTGRREQTGDWLNRTPATPEEEFISDEKAELEGIYLEKLAEEISDDEELVKIYEAMRNSCNSNQAISKFTGINIKKVETAQKRLNRRTDKLNKEFLKTKKTIAANLRS